MSDGSIQHFRWNGDVLIPNSSWRLLRRGGASRIDENVIKTYLPMKPHELILKIKILFSCRIQSSTFRVGFCAHVSLATATSLAHDSRFALKAASESSKLAHRWTPNLNLRATENRGFSKYIRRADR